MFLPQNLSRRFSLFLTHLQFPSGKSYQFHVSSFLQSPVGDDDGVGACDSGEGAGVGGWRQILQAFGQKSCIFSPPPISFEQKRLGLDGEPLCIQLHFRGMFRTLNLNCWSLKQHRPHVRGHAAWIRGTAQNLSRFTESKSMNEHVLPGLL